MSKNFESNQVVVNCKAVMSKKGLVNYVETVIDLIFKVYLVIQSEVEVLQQQLYKAIYEMVGGILNYGQVIFPHDIIYYENGKLLRGDKDNKRIHINNMSYILNYS